MRSNIILLTILISFVGTCNSSYAAKQVDLVIQSDQATPKDEAIRLDPLNTTSALKKNNPLNTTGVIKTSNLLNTTGAENKTNTVWKISTDFKTCGAPDTTYEFYSSEYKKDIAKGSNRITGLFAREYNDHGAKFCVRGIEAWRKSRYREMDLNVYTSTQDCVWLCRDGWTGDKCNTPQNTATTCDPTQLTANPDTLNKNTVSKSTYMKVLKYQKKSCNDEHFDEKNGKAEGDHSLFLAVLGYAPEKHGAFVNTIVVRSWCGLNRTKDDCKIITYKSNTSADELLCMNGYKHAADGKSCVPINENTCKNIPWCDGWNKSEYNSSIYESVVKDGKCQQFICKGKDMAFKKDTKQCITCTDQDTTLRTITDNVCIETPITETEPATGPCDGWNDFANNSQYEQQLDDEKKCYVYRCKNPDTGFTSKDDKTCVPCTGKNKVKDKNGVCQDTGTNIENCAEWKDKSTDGLVKLLDSQRNCYIWECPSGQAFESSDKTTCVTCNGTTVDGVCDNSPTKPVYIQTRKSDLSSKKDEYGEYCWMKCNNSESFKQCIK